METQDNFFSNEDITVTFEPCKCIHAEKCAQELSQVFRTSVIPWIHLDGTKTKRIIEQIKKHKTSQQVLVNKMIFLKKYKDQNDRNGKIYRFQKWLDPFSFEK